jgi:Plasmid recombination enzyme.
MYDGKQVVRVENSYKSKDLYNIGVEMKDRKGTGNYEETRTEYNITYVGITERNLYQEVKSKLKEREIEYPHKDRTNMLNGMVFTSGNEFFEILGMKFKDSGRTYQTGEKKGKSILIPNINSKDDIPQKVIDYFDYCMEFLKEQVGEENIILAQAHFDEDTPHLQAYFLPIVASVRRKCFEKDDKGNVIKEKALAKNGKDILTPKLLRDKDNKIVYEIVKGKFLNNDQFWKQRGGQHSFARLQDDFNKFINEKGFKLDRGKVGAKVEHKTKLEWEIEEKENQLNSINKEIDYSDNILKSNKDTIKEITDYKSTTEVLNPKKGIIGYKEADVENVIDYSKQLEKINVINHNEIKKNNSQITKLKNENANLKDNGELLKRNEIIKEQATTIEDLEEQLDEKDTIIQKLENTITKLQKTLEKWKNKFFEVIDKIFGKQLSKYEDDYLDYADDFIDDRKYKDKNKSDDFEIGM